MAKTFSINTYNNAEGALSKGTRLTVSESGVDTVIGIPSKDTYDSAKRTVLVDIIEAETSSTLTADEKTSLNTTITSYTFADDLN